MENEIFTIRVRRCKRCGRILTSEETVKEGYGHVCKMKADEEERANDPINGQMSILDMMAWGRKAD